MSLDVERGVLMDWLESAYRTMLKIRLFEESSIELYKEGLIGGSLHCSIGQEAVAAGVCGVLRGDDRMTTTYRGRGHAIAKGTELYPLFAEILGRSTGLCGGRGGPMHITDVAHGHFGANAIVAAGLPFAAGLAWAAKRLHSDRVVVTFFGDGATNQGAFHEALNLASIWDLPVVFVCENNLYSEMTPIKDMIKNENLSERAAAYRIPAHLVDGMRVDQVRQAAQEAVERARSGGGPTFIEAKTYRLSGHMFGDLETYRSKDEVEHWKGRDPLLVTRSMLEAQGVAATALGAWQDQIAAEVANAAERALGDPEPEPETAYQSAF